MRTYAKVSPRFWTGSTGRAIREMGPDCQLVALYLLTAPSSNMIGLYYLPLPTVAHETGMTLEGASKALRRVADGVFAHYDEASETVWIVNMARDQIGEQLKPSDKQAIGIARQLEEHRASSLARAFHAHYCEAYHLPDMKPLASPLQAPSKPLRSQEIEQEQEQEQKFFAAETAPPPVSGAVPPSTPKAKRAPKAPRDEALDLLTINRADARARIAAASNGRYLDTPPPMPAPLLLDKHRSASPDGALFTRIGQWLAAGGDGYKTTLDGRNLKDIDAWAAQAKAWDGRPIGKPAAFSARPEPRANPDSARPIADLLARQGVK